MASREKGSRQKADREPQIGPTKMKFDGDPVKVDKWSTSAVKNALDDMAKKILKEELECVEDYRMIDQRLFLSALACSFSLLALVYDYLFPFPASLSVLFFCAVSYFILMGVLTLFAMFIEKNIFVVGLEKDAVGVRADNKWSLGSSLPRYSSEYTLTVHYLDGETKKTRVDTLTKSVACWFDENGVLLVNRFFADVHTFLVNTGRGKKDK